MLWTIVLYKLESIYRKPLLVLLFRMWFMRSQHFQKWSFFFLAICSDRAFTSYEVVCSPTNKALSWLMGYISLATHNVRGLWSIDELLSWTRAFERAKRAARILEDMIWISWLSLMWSLVENLEDSGTIQRIKVNDGNYDDYITLCPWVDNNTADQKYVRIPTHYI